MVYDDLLDNIAEQLSAAGHTELLEKIRNPEVCIHLALCREPYIQYMISGKKTIESRITKNKCMPYGKVEKGDLVILKQTSGPVLAVFSVAEVNSFDTRYSSLPEIRDTYQKQLCIHDDWWENKKDARYAALIGIREIAALQPIRLALEKNRQSWIILRERGKKPGVPLNIAEEAASFYPYAGIDQLQEAFKTGKLTVKELVLLFLNRIAEFDRGDNGLKAVLEINPDALFLAGALDRKLAGGERTGALFGIPVLIKDNINTSDRMHTRAGSFALKDNYAPTDAAIVKKLREADAVLLGKANMTEFANFMTDGEMPDGYSACGGQVINPYVRDKTPGGSSSGSAVAVAAGFCTAAIGTETCGSIVSPSGQNGIVGIKPTLGLVGRSGIIPISSTLDTAGPMTRTVRDAAIVLEVISGEDPEDPATFRQPTPACADAAAESSLTGLKIGIYRPETTACQEMHKARFAFLCKKMREEGAILTDNLEFHEDFNVWHITKYEFKSAMNYYLSKCHADTNIRTLSDIIACHEAYPDIALRYGQRNLTEIEAHTGGNLTEPEYLRMLIRRDEVIQSFDALFAKYDIDIIMCETYNNTIAPFTGFPSLILPIGQREDKLPIDCYFMARRFQEKTLIKAAAAIEKLLGVTLRPVL